jgi:hypothetical protein
VKKGNPIGVTNEGPQNMQVERKKFKSEVKNEVKQFFGVSCDWLERMH